MTVIIPMSGEGSRFKKAGFLLPKPLILIDGRPMIEKVIKNINLPHEHHVFIVRKEHLDYGLKDYLSSLVDSCDIVITGLTEGAACSVALAEPFCKDERIVVANSDQFIDMDLEDFFERSKLYDGTILTFTADHPKWSYIKIEKPLFRFSLEKSPLIKPQTCLPYTVSRITELAEKKVISNIATVGIYTWNKREFLFDSIRQMIKDNFRVNNEFYLCPSYSYILDKQIYNYHIDSMRVWGLGTTEDLEYYYDNFTNTR